MKRLFFALWPDRETRDEVGKLNRAVPDGHLRKVKQDNIHVTLLFLGGVNVEEEQAIRQEAATIQTPPLQIEFDRLSLWRGAGILCLTASEQPQQLLNLVEALTSVALKQGLEVESKAYKAHVTLGRKAVDKPEIEFKPVHWPADSFALVESFATESGVHYQVVQSWPLLAGE